MLSKRFSWGHKWILGTAETVSISHRHWTTEALKGWNRGYFVLSWKHISGLAQLLWMQTMEHKRDLKPDRMPLTAPFIMPCFLILKGYFSLIILWSTVEFPKEKICCCLLFVFTGRVRGWGFSALLAGTSTGKMLNFSRAWARTF